MAKETFKYGDIVVDVEHVGEGSAPWDERKEPRHEYKINVRGAGGRYKAGGWGSTSDFETGQLAHQSMAWSAIDDLHSALTDPDEFIDIVIGEAKGRDALERGKMAERVVKAARKFDETALARAAEMRREEEEGA
jgi:hypothetical protein